MSIDFKQQTKVFDKYLNDQSNDEKAQLLKFQEMKKLFENFSVLSSVKISKDSK